MLIWFLPVFLVFLLIGLPVFFGLLAAPGLLLWLNGQEKDITLLYRNVYNGMDSFPLMAIPFFMLAGELMNKGGITMRLVEFSQALMGHLRGGLAHVNILSSMLFAGLSGSAVADTSALGSMLIPAMEKQGLHKALCRGNHRGEFRHRADHSAVGHHDHLCLCDGRERRRAVPGRYRTRHHGRHRPDADGQGHGQQVRSSQSTEDRQPRPDHGTGGILVLLHCAEGKSGCPVHGDRGPCDQPDRGRVPFNDDSFILFAVFLAVSHVLLWKLRSAVSEDFRVVCKKAVAPLQTPIIILGGILLGVFTPTEAAAVAVAYALVIGFFVLHSIKVSEIPGVLNRAGITSAVVLLLVGAAMAFKTVVSLSHAPEIMAEFVLTLSENPLILLFLINLLLFVVGMFLDAGPAIIILGPILGPIFVNLGVDPIHFAIIMSVNLTIGLATPPMGLVLFVAASVSRERVETIAKAILPFLAVEIAVIFLITYIPALSMTIPRLTGFAN